MQQKIEKTIADIAEACNSMHNIDQVNVNGRVFYAISTQAIVDDFRFLLKLLQEEREKNAKLIETQSSPCECMTICTCADGQK